MAFSTDINPKTKRNSLGYANLTPLEKRAHSIYTGQRHRDGVLYGPREFIDWWVREYKKKTWKRPHVARFDHDKPYSFDNIEMQEQAENNRERNQRRGNPCATRKRVHAFTLGGKFIREFPSMQQAANFYEIHCKTVKNHCTGKTTIVGKFGPGKKLTVRFQWA